jgi:hypothetical protein
VQIALFHIKNNAICTFFINILTFVTMEDGYTDMILERVKELLTLKTDLQLSDYLKVKPGTISSWRSRNSIDFQRIFDICKENKFNLNYIIWGMGEPYYIPETAGLNKRDLKAVLENTVKSISKALEALPQCH